MEPICQEINNRYVMFPIRYKSIWDMYKKALSAFWTAEEIDLSKDYSDWLKLSDPERHFIKHILAFFAGSDGIVNENLSVRFMNEVAAPEAKAFYGFQIAMENIHCVSADTNILTREGYLCIGPLEGKVVDVWNGEEWSKVMVMKTSDAAPAYTVELSNGMKLTCTPTHEWLITADAKDSRVHTQDLEAGMTLTQFAYPEGGIEFPQNQIFSNAAKHGASALTDGVGYNPTLFNCRYQEYVPINYAKDTRYEWLNGMIGANGRRITFADTGFTFVRVDSKDPLILSNLQLMLTSLDIRSWILNGESIYIAPNRRVNLNGVVCSTECKQPFDNKDIRVTRITENEEKKPMYCFEENKRHTGVFNGILTGQSETYSLLLDTYIKDTAEKDHLLDAINTIPCIAKKAEWAMKWISSDTASFATRLVAFACVEGIFFSGAFCAIFWLKERGVMPGLTLSNEFISRDESLHTEFAMLLYDHLENKLTSDQIHAIITEAVAIEKEFIIDSISCNMLGMNQDLMSQYIEFVADRLAVQMGTDTIYNVSNPFSFMDRISLNNKSNFFEHTRQSDYAKARVGVKAEENQFSLDANF